MRLPERFSVELADAVVTRLVDVQRVMAHQLHEESHNRLGHQSTQAALLCTARKEKVKQERVNIEQAKWLEKQVSLLHALSLQATAYKGHVYICVTCTGRGESVALMISQSFEYLISFWALYTTVKSTKKIHSLALSNCMWFQHLKTHLCLPSPIWGLFLMSSPGIFAR